MLDEGFRRRVRALAATDGDALEPAAEERIVQTISLRGPALVTKARRWRTASWLAGPLLAVAAAVALLVGFGKRGVESRAEPAATAHAPACATWSSRSPERFTVEAARQVLDLGAVAFVTAPLEAEVDVVEAVGCRTVLSLVSGRVAVSAKDLGGGKLIVRAGETEVSVRGTLFAVERENDGVVVEVVEGLVAVRRGSEIREVAAGQRLVTSDLGNAIGRLSEHGAASLRRAVEPVRVLDLDALGAPDTVTRPAPARPTTRTARAKPAAAPTGGDVEADESTVDSVASAVVLEEAEPPAPESSPGQLLELAERRRRAGEYAEARGLYRSVGSGSGPTAEAAWLGLARMELSLGDTVAARRATEQRRARFGAGALGPEARWIDVRIHRLAGDVPAARRVAQELMERWPLSPQAEAARLWLRQGGPP